MREERPKKELEAILSEEQVRSLHLIETLREIRPEDLAPLLVYFDSDDKIQIFEHLEAEDAAHVLAETDPVSREEILDRASLDKIAPVFEKLPPDEAADFVHHLDPARRAPLLRLSPTVAEEVHVAVLGVIRMKGQTVNQSVDIEQRLGFVDARLVREAQEFARSGPNAKVLDDKIPVRSRFPFEKDRLLQA